MVGPDGDCIISTLGLGEGDGVQKTNAGQPKGLDGEVPLPGEVGGEWKEDQKDALSGGGEEDREVMQESCTKKEEEEVHPIFTNELFHVRQRIISYAMRKNNGALCASYIANLRLVQKEWLAKVTQLLGRTLEPLYHLSLTKDNSLNGRPLVAAHGKLLDQFMAAMKRRIEQPFPTYRLKISADFFQLENYQSLKSFLVECGQGLVDLELKIPRYGGSLPCIFPNFKLPVLQKMTVYFSPTRLAIDPYEPVVDNATMLLTHLLNNAGSLKKLAFPYDQNGGPPPNGLQYVTLPPSIVKLVLECEIEDQKMEILSRNWLPNLTTLCLLIPREVLPEDVWAGVFENVRTTVQTLEINGSECAEPSGFNNVITFPVMEKLKKLELFYVSWEPKQERLDVDDWFPKLETLKIRHITRGMFKKWALGPSASSVTTVELGLVNGNLLFGQPGFPLPPTMEDMHRLCSTYPNVQCLSLTLTGSQACGLKHMFVEMRQLNFLTLDVADSDLVEGSDCWDSILIGLPIQFVTAMRLNPGWPNYVRFEMEEMPSIRMLTELTKLCLHCFNPKTGDDEDSDSTLSEEEQSEPCSLISDLSFNHALLQMPSVKELCLSGRFRASTASAEAWKMAGRKISYTP